MFSFCVEEEKGLAYHSLGITGLGAGSMLGFKA